MICVLAVLPPMPCTVPRTTAFSPTVCRARRSGTRRAEAIATLPARQDLSGPRSPRLLGTCSVAVGISGRRRAPCCCAFCDRDFLTLMALPAVLACGFLEALWAAACGATAGTATLVSAVARAAHNAADGEKVAAAEPPTVAPRAALSACPPSPFLRAPLTPPFPPRPPRLPGPPAGSTLLRLAGAAAISDVAS